jgi:hypothetical protein
MFYIGDHRADRKGNEYRFLVTNKKKWKNFTTKKRA